MVISWKSHELYVELYMRECVSKHVYEIIRFPYWNKSTLQHLNKVHLGIKNFTGFKPIEFIRYRVNEETRVSMQNNPGSFIPSCVSSNTRYFSALTSRRDVKDKK